MGTIHHKPIILIVDDTPENITLIISLLDGEYQCKIATNGEKALQIVHEAPQPDLILLDVVMPKINGYELCKILKNKAETKNIPIIFLTSKTERTDEAKGFSLGAVDYIKKPINPTILLARVKTHIALHRAQAALEDQNMSLELTINKRTEQLLKTQNAIIIAMASLAETRDVDTGHHITRTQHYVFELAKELSSHPRFSSFLTPYTIDLLFKSAPLHDLGKIGVPDRILLKPGKLTPEEFGEMKKHTLYGRNVIMIAEKSLDSSNNFLTLAREIAYSHHEKWDGSGYPEGLKGDAIPIPARLMALADVYDALISKRCYKESMGHAEASEIIKMGQGTHFDPDVVLAFSKLQGTFLKIAQRFSFSQPDIRFSNAEGLTDTATPSIFHIAQ